MPVGPSSPDTQQQTGIHVGSDVPGPWIVGEEGKVDKFRRLVKGAVAVATGPGRAPTAEEVEELKRRKEVLEKAGEEGRELGYLIRDARETSDRREGEWVNTRQDVLEEHNKMLKDKTPKTAVGLVEKYRRGPMSTGVNAGGSGQKK